MQYFIAAGGAVQAVLLLVLFVVADASMIAFDFWPDRVGA